jgi:hypothetical protein
MAVLYYHRVCLRFSRRRTASYPSFVHVLIRVLPIRFVLILNCAAESAHVPCYSSVGHLFLSFVNVVRSQGALVTRLRQELADERSRHAANIDSLTRQSQEEQKVYLHLKCVAASVALELIFCPTRSLGASVLVARVQVKSRHYDARVGGVESQIL